MENSASAQNVPRSRQKSCNHCVLIKRRCDRRLPVCSRCIEKNVACSYSKSRLSRMQDRQEPSLDFSSLETADVGFCTTDPTGSTDFSYLDMMMPGPHVKVATPLPSHQMDPSLNEDFLLEPFVDLMDGRLASPTMLSMQDQSLVIVEPEPIHERPKTPAKDNDVQAYQKLGHLCLNVEPWHVHDPSTALYYVVNRVKGFIDDIATRNAAPFLHRYLYRAYTPPCILSCFSSNVLYANRTQANLAMVIQAVHKGVGELLVVEANRINATPIERLARTQALLLYQVIRLFDGDIALRSRAEKDLLVLQTWLADLVKLRDNLGDLAKLGDTVLRQQPPPQWEQWIFAESVRRTIFMSHSILMLYRLMKGSDDPEDADCTWSYANRWTLSRHLWEADNPFQFARMWKHKPHFVMTNYTFQHFLEHGRGDDSDEFSEILLSLYMGVNETIEFVKGKPIDE